jgi:hypothetical protein
LIYFSLSYVSTRDIAGKAGGNEVVLQRVAAKCEEEKKEKRK